MTYDVYSHNYVCSNKSTQHDRKTVSITEATPGNTDSFIAFNILFVYWNEDIKHSKLFTIFFSYRIN